MPNPFFIFPELNRDRKSDNHSHRVILLHLQLGDFGCIANRRSPLKSPTTLSGMEVSHVI